jgi:hypothetical protein
MSSSPVLKLTAVLAASFACHVAMAQASAPPVSRAAVKAETRAAEKSGQLTPAGEDSPGAKVPDTKSTKTRAERKAETLLARKAGTLKPAGPGGTLADRTPSTAKSAKTRTERKAETLQAAKEGKLVPAGEGPETPKK